MKEDNMLHRLFMLMAVVAASLAMAVTPAFADDDERGDDDAAPAAQLAQNDDDGGDDDDDGAGAPAGDDDSAVPRGGIQTGAGGTAEQDGAPIVAILGGLALATGAGGVMLRRRVTE